MVNRDTHGFAGAEPATLAGWRRVWRYTTLRQVAYLTVVRDPMSRIDGLIAPVPDEDWDALDYRERAYARIPAAHEVTHGLAHSPDIAVYSVPGEPEGAVAPDHALLLSYIDVVVQGYLREFGRAGVERFFATTDGWAAPVVNDRDAPRYPRHCKLTHSETALVDDHLGQLGVTIQDVEHAKAERWRE